MEIFRLENTKNNVLCTKCNHILKFNINHEKFAIEGICKNGHFFNDISFKSFLDSFIKSTSSKKVNCYKCHINNEKNIFVCQCNKLFCNICISSHLQEEKHKIKKYKNDYKFCDIHKKLNLFYCNNCQIEICVICKINHQNHCIKPIVDFLPNQKIKESLPKIAENFKENILNLKEEIINLKKDLEEKFKELESLFDFIEKLNEKLFQKYNFEIDEFNNYENINYINRYINNEKILRVETYLNYLFFNQKLDLEEKEITAISIDNKKVISNRNFYSYYNYNDLEFFRDNLFFEKQIADFRRLNLEKNITLFELKNYSFKNIVTYSLDKFKNIDKIKPAKYGNYFLINFEKKKNIKILEYDNNSKTLTLSKKEIKANKSFLFDKKFDDFIDDKNGNIITIDFSELIVWKKNKKKNNFTEIMSFAQKYYKLLNINEKMFFANSRDFLTFLNHDKYEVIASIQYKEEVDCAYELNENILIMKSGRKYILISLKFFEISQIIDFGENIYFIKAKDNILLQYIINNKQIIIIKRIFNEKEGSFNKEENITIHTNSTTNYPKILATNNNKILIGDSGLLSIYSDII